MLWLAGGVSVVRARRSLVKAGETLVWVTGDGAVNIEDVGRDPVEIFAPSIAIRIRAMETVDREALDDALFRRSFLTLEEMQVAVGGQVDPAEEALFVHVPYDGSHVVHAEPGERDLLTIICGQIDALPMRWRADALHMAAAAVAQLAEQ
jgi:hypothetical protein